MGFVHLNVHSCYSLLAGTLRPEELARLARRQGFAACALTDTDGLYAAVPFQKACEKEGLRSLLGAEITRPRLEQDALAPRLNGDDGGARPGADPDDDDFPDHEPGGFARERPAGPGTPRHRATLLVRNEAGYRLLGEILTSRHLDDAFTLEDALARALDSGDLYVITAGESLLRTLAPRERDAARRRAGPRLFVELRTGAGAGPMLRHQTLLRLAEQLALPVAATGGVFFGEAGDHFLHRVLGAMRLNTCVDKLPPDAAAPKTAWLMSESQMLRALGVPSAADLARRGRSSRDDDARPNSKAMDPRLREALDASARIAADCDYRIPTGRPRPPRFALPPGPDGRPQEPDAFLYRLAHEGLRERLGIAPGDRDRDARANLAALRRELHVIRRRQVSAYFLIAWDLVRFGRSRHLASLGRGSAANSLVSYALSITHVHPLEHNLYFERFLNLERSGLPDFDIDFGSEARYTILDYAFARYGRERTAMIGTYQTFRPRGAFRRLVGALGLDEAAWEPIIDVLPHWGDCKTLRKQLKSDPKSAHLDLEAGDMPRLLDLAERLDELPQHLGTHPCGIVIAPGPIAHFVPLQRGGQGLTITQWDMHAVEAAGLVKMDILGQRGLAVIDETCARVRENFGQAPRLAGEPPPRQTPRSVGGRTASGPAREAGNAREAVGGTRNTRTAVGEAAGAVNPFTDPATRALLASGRSEGCFYIESPIMMQILRQSHCEDFETLTALSSIIRPGVSSHGGKRQYLLRHLGREAVSVLHALLEPVLRDTYGCLIYQEQVIRVIQVMGGMSLGEADRFRKIMSGKGGGDPLDFEAQFLSGALAILAAAGEEPESSDRIAREVCRQVACFAGYAFCKAHSASFARESFESAYWKAHYPAEFMAAVIEERGGYYTSAEYVEEARRLGLEILPPHVNAGTVETLGFSAGSIAPDPAGDAGRPAAIEFTRVNSAGRNAPGEDFTRVNSLRGAAEDFTRVKSGGRDFPRGNGAEHEITAPGDCTRVQRGERDCTRGQSSERDFIRVNESPRGTRVSEAPRGRLRVGLSFLRGVRRSALDWVAEEGRRRPFLSLQELVERARDGGPEAPRRYEVARLIRAGACDGLPVEFRGEEGLAPGPPRPELLSALAGLWPGASEAKADAEALAPLPWPAAGAQGGNALRAGDNGGAGAGNAAAGNAAAGDEIRARALQELALLGFTPSAHPLCLCPAFPAARARCLTARSLQEQAQKAAADAPAAGQTAETFRLGRVSLLGLKVSGKRTHTETDGRIMAFFTFSDETGNFEAVFYPDDYARLARRLRGVGPFRISGPAEVDLGEVIIEAKELESLSGGSPAPLPRRR